MAISIPGGNAETFEFGPLEGRLVTLLSSSSEELTDRTGRACAWSSSERRYLVETFSGTRLEVGEDEVEEYEHDAAEDAGFDIAWPLRSPHGHAIFSFMVAENLKRKGYCMIQAFGNAEAREAMVALADARADDFTRPKREFEEAYLGRNPMSKVAWIEGERVDNVALEHYNRCLKDLHLLLLPVAGEVLGFAPWTNRMGTMLRRSFADAKEEQTLDIGSLDEEDVSEGAIEKHLEFVQRRRLCLLYVVDGAGGVIELHPRDGSAFEAVDLQPGRDRLLVFRHDEMSYVYEPEDSSDLVIQTWIVDPPSQLQLTKINGEFEEEDDTKRGPPAPPGPGVLTWITSLMCRVAGKGYGGGEEVWPIFSTNVDGYIEIPNGRFDLDFYYDPNGDFGKTRTKHSALVSDEDLQLFDPEFFQWTEEEAQHSSCILRLCMDGGFEVMYRAGFSRDELRGQRVGYYVGHTCDFESATGYSAPHRLTYFLGLTGRASIIDTACSSALVSMCMCHQDVALGRAEAGAIAGVGCLLDVRPYIAMSSGRMISSRGRSHTFDHSADGYGRGEGIACCFLEDGRNGGGKTQLREKAQICQPTEMSRFAASAMNQDGRSASITAPSGPAQTACIKASLKECGLTPDRIIFGECHGTGTALGDPIEVGSSRMVNDPYDRYTPLMLGAAKTQVGHLELGAGAVGAMRSVLVLVYATVPPNCHVGQLNEHFSLDGFPVSMPCEAVATPQKANFLGVNSFGFGGTNARCELWGRWRGYDEVNAKDGSVLPKMDRLNFISTPCPLCLGSMCWLCGCAIPKNAAFRGKHHCSAIRDEFAKYEYCSNCYDGGYQHSKPDYADVPNPGGLRVYLTGSWSDWKGFSEMNPVEDEAGVYECAIRLGDMRREQFRIVVDMDPVLSVYPVTAKAGKATRVAGPDNEWKGLHWEINGEDDDMPEGTVYRIVFTWPEDGEAWKSISWEPTEEMLPSMQITRKESGHRYTIAGTWTSWVGTDMARHPLESALWEAQVRIGQSGEEQFRFIRDGDEQQLIYPALAQAMDPSVPVMGPDGSAQGRSWLLRGKPGSTQAVRLHIVNGQITVVVSSPEDGERTWRSVPKQYCLVGSWTEGDVSVMEADPARPGYYRSWMAVGPNCREEFQVCVDGDPAKRIYPVFPNAPPGTALSCGPDTGGDDLTWEIIGRPGQEFEIVLDLQAEDRRKVVTSRLLSLEEDSAVGFAQLTA
uniref:Type I polyketide synthase n=1 Tax=Gambierdiscus polynesiensis TaxID=439318 RepID=A0A1S6K7W7_9DINO|nr:type I polyketide synthase [Gambierdiscus polynesiensis]